MKHICFLLLLVFSGLTCAAQSNLPNSGNDPLYILDSVVSGSSVLQTLNPNDIAMITVLKDETAFTQFGDAGKNGVIFIETKSLVRKRYIRYLSSKSADYAAATANGDAGVQYVVNNEVIKKDFIDALDAVADSTFISLKIIDKAALAKDYNINDKTYGAL